LASDWFVFDELWEDDYFPSDASWDTPFAFSVDPRLIVRGDDPNSPSRLHGRLMDLNHRITELEDDISAVAGHRHRERGRYTSICGALRDPGESPRYFDLPRQSRSPSCEFPELVKGPQDVCRQLIEALELWELIEAATGTGERDVKTASVQRGKPLHTKTRPRGNESEWRVREDGG
jgi:hypothetical protein